MQKKNNHYPLLVLHQGEFTNIIHQQRKFTSKIHHPDHDTQVTRIDDKINNIIKSIKSISETSDGIDPEYSLIFELASPLDEFQKVAEKIGLEFLGEEGFDIVPDNEFYNIEKDGSPSSSKIHGKLFMVMSNIRSSENLLKLWNFYKNNQNLPYGYNKFKELFEKLFNIRKWNSEDRFNKTGIREEWKNLVKFDIKVINCEIELWYRRSKEEQRKAETSLNSTLENHKVKVIKNSRYEEIGYHGLIVQFPKSEAIKILEDPSNDIFKFRK